MKNHKVLAYALMRLALGVNMFGHGFFRLLTGVTAFASGMAQGMGKGPLPHALSFAFGLCIPPIEVAMGVLLIVGLWTPYALAAGLLFMSVLTFGTTSVQNWTGAGTQLQYSFVFFAVLLLAEYDTLSVDAYLARRHV